jgi:23S rRNA pseudouridine1911/1915/1917 synthase
MHTYKPHQPVIVYEDEQLLVVDKPAGLMVHGDGRSEEATLADWLVENQKVSPEIGEPWTDPRGVRIPRPGVVHRLDKDTSGLLVIAKNQKMYEWLKEQFKARTVYKTYEALVHGILKEDAGVVDRPIGRSGSDFRKKSAQRGAVGVLRDAHTEYKVLRRYSERGAAGETHVELHPKTGRTHQLRVHMKAINHPIVGDVLYGLKEDRDGGRPLMLRAVRLVVPMPDGGMKEFYCKGL